MATLTRAELFPATTTATTPRPDRRQMSAAATLIAGVVMAAGAFVAPLGLALAYGIYQNAPFDYMRIGLAAAFALSSMAFALVLLASFLVQSVIMPAAPMTPAPSGPMTVTVNAPRLDPDVRLVPLLAGPTNRTIDDVPEADLRWFIEGLSQGKGHNQAAWVGLRAPSGVVIDPGIWRALSNPLRKVGAIVGVSKGKSGRLITTDQATLLSLVGLEDPYSSLDAFDRVYPSGKPF